MINSASFHAVVSGRVQGVYFRAFVAEKAASLGLKGYVRNLDSRTEVEVFAEGKRSELEKLVGLLEKGPRTSRVEKVNITWSHYSGSHTTFSILY